MRLFIRIAWVSKCTFFDCLAATGPIRKSQRELFYAIKLRIQDVCLEHCRTVDEFLVEGDNLWYTDNTQEFCLT